jgi:hypothetical protein
MFMHSIEYNYAPRALANTWTINSDCNIGHALRNENDFALSTTRIEFVKKIPIYSLPSAWNEAGDIQFHQNRTTFRIALKDKLLSEIME